jgi:hypothetical protein
LEFLLFSPRARTSPPPAPNRLTGDKLTGDYCVWREGRCIGRIRLAREYTTAKWTWFINPPLAIPAWGTGAENSLEDAKAAFRKAGERFYETLTPANIALACD